MGRMIIPFLQAPVAPEPRVRERIAEGFADGFRVGIDQVLGHMREAIYDTAGDAAEGFPDSLRRRLASEEDEPAPRVRETEERRSGRRAGYAAARAAVLSVLESDVPMSRMHGRIWKLTDELYERAERGLKPEELLRRTY